MGNQCSGKGLSTSELEFLKQNTSYNEKTIKEWHAGFVADCPDGKLSPAAFMKIYSKGFPDADSKEFCDHVFRAFDRDMDGVIDFKEFLQAINVTSSGTLEEKLRWTFRF